MNDELLYEIAPLANEWAVGLASGGLLDAEQVAVLDGRLARGGRLLEDPDLQPLWQLALGAVETANSSYFRFDVVGAFEPDEPRRIDLSEGESTADAGCGLSQRDTRRKLVALIALDGSVGATLRQDHFGKEIDLEPGMIVMAPAYCLLRVVSSQGPVPLLTFHAVGPTFR